MKCFVTASYLESCLGEASNSNGSDSIQFGVVELEPDGELMVGQTELGNLVVNLSR